MKKNLKIVSAAAAALLAVAPVAATAVSTVNATVSEGNASVLPEYPGYLGGHNDPANFKTVVTDTPNQTGQHVTLSQSELATLNIPAGFDSYNGVVTGTTATTTPGKYKQTIAFQLRIPDSMTDAQAEAKFGGHYSIIKVGNVRFVGKNGAIANFSFSRFAQYGNKQGTPFFYDKANKNAHVTTGSILLQNRTFSATDILNLVHNQYGAATNAGSAKTSIVTSASDIESQLAKAGVNKNSSGTYDFPAQSFNITIEAKADDGQTAKLTVKVNLDNRNINYPVFTYTVGTTSEALHNGASVTPDARLYREKDGSIDHSKVDALIGNSAFVQGNDEAANATVPVHSDWSAVNENKAGIYPVVYTATNPAGYTSKVTLYVVVGQPQSKVQYISASTDTVPTVNIDGNNVVTASSSTLKNGDAVNTFGSVTINGTKYVRLDQADSSHFVEAKYVSDTQPANTGEYAHTTRVWNKKASYIYNENHVRQGNNIMYKIGSGHNVVANADGSAKVYNVGGIQAYKLSDGYYKGRYVDVRNFSTSRVHHVTTNSNHKKATVRSRVFDVRGKAVKHMYINKGATVRVYGTKTIKGQRMYKIAKHNRYVKVANFR